MRPYIAVGLLQNKAQVYFYVHPVGVLTIAVYRYVIDIYIPRISDHKGISFIY